MTPRERSRLEALRTDLCDRLALCGDTVTSDGRSVLNALVARALTSQPPPSQPLLGSFVQMGERRLRNALHELSRLGFVLTLRRGSAPGEVHLNLDRLAAWVGADGRAQYGPAATASAVKAQPLESQRLQNAGTSHRSPSISSSSSSSSSPPTPPARTSSPPAARIEASSALQAGAADPMHPLWAPWPEPGPGQWEEKIRERLSACGVPWGGRSRDTVATFARLIEMGWHWAAFDFACWRFANSQGRSPNYLRRIWEQREAELVQRAVAQGEAGNVSYELLRRKGGPK